MKSQQQQPLKSPPPPPPHTEPIVFKILLSFEYMQILEYIRKFNSLFSTSTI